MLKIVADSSCDLKNGEGIEIVPLNIYTDERAFVDDDTLDKNEMLDYLAQYKARSYTSCPNATAWMKAYEGAEEVMVFTITSKLSGTYNAACNARDMFLEEHENVKIEVIDSLSTSAEITLLIEKARELEKQGMSFAEIVKGVRDYQTHTHMIFSLQSLHNLAVNGRVSKVIAGAVGIVGLSVIAMASEVGDIKAIDKARGVKKNIRTVIENAVELGYEGGKAIISHVQNIELAEGVAAYLKELYPNVEVAIQEASGLVCFYAERGAILIAFEV